MGSFRALAINLFRPSVNGSWCGSRAPSLERRFGVSVPELQSPEDRLRLLILPRPPSVLNVATSMS
jgi:hypothetical protein